MTTDSATLPRTACDAEAGAGRRSGTITLSTPIAGMLWFGGWLFTIGFAQLGFWKGVLALVVWPYFLGVLAR